MTDLTSTALKLISEDPALAEEIRKQLSSAHISTLTPRQRQCFEFIKSFVAENDYPPTLAEIAEHLGVASRGNVCLMVSELQKHGLIQRSPKGRRYIHLVESAA
jgi:repressor LexA